eukprot:1256329-Prymnesium_polylepis.1
MASDPQLLQTIKRGRHVSRFPLTGVICSDKRSLGGGVCGDVVMTARRSTGGKEPRRGLACAHKLTPELTGEI